mgnify:CR=1 FL=1
MTDSSTRLSGLLTRSTAFCSIFRFESMSTPDQSIHCRCVDLLPCCSSRVGETVPSFSSHSVLNWCRFYMRRLGVNNAGLLYHPPMPRARVRWRVRERWRRSADDLSRVTLSQNLYLRTTAHAGGRRISIRNILLSQRWKEQWRLPYALWWRFFRCWVNLYTLCYNRTIVLQNIHSSSSHHFSTCLHIAVSDL